MRVARATPAQELYGGAEWRPVEVEGPGGPDALSPGLLVRGVRGSGMSNQRCRRRPTLPRPLGRSTIGAAGLNGRVRDGNGCGPCALVASEMDSSIEMERDRRSEWTEESWSRRDAPAD